MQIGAGAQAGEGSGDRDRRRPSPRTPDGGHWQEETVVFRVGPEAKRARPETRAESVLREVYRALQEKGYDPISQLVGYLLSGDPTYITSYAGARALIRSVERDELLEELLRTFMQGQASGGAGGVEEPEREPGRNEPSPDA